MKKSLLILGLAVTLFSCNKNEGTVTEFKTAYVDTQKLMEESKELKDLESRSKVKQEEMGRELDDKVQKLKMDYASAQNEAQRKGPQWAQLKAQELQRREQEISVMQESMIKQFQEEFGSQSDTIRKAMREYIKDYGKKNGYDYIYGTGDAVSIIYAKDAYDITEDIIKALNEKYSGNKTTVEPTEEKAATTEKEEPAKK